MSSLLEKSRFVLQAWRELGPAQIGLAALYRLGLRSGYYRWRSRPPRPPAALQLRTDLCRLPDPAGLCSLLTPAGLDALRLEADEIAAGQVRLFGGPPLALNLTPSGPLRHWTEHESNQAAGQDIKFTWEPARGGWAVCLARAYHLLGDERWAEAFWRHTLDFLSGNPPYLGPNWASGQEAALRIMAWVFAAQVFVRSPHSTPERRLRLAQAIAEHASRIPPTLLYARAQNNNHLLTEAAGLYTAGLALPAHPQAKNWRRSGWKWLHNGLQAQISPQGAYAQHSANYQRLMLQTALWVYQLAGSQAETFPGASLEKCSATTRWLHCLLDPISGHLPNLGPNDGAYIFPLSGSGAAGFADYRPLLQAAGLAFCGTALCSAGPWDEYAAWLGLNAGAAGPSPALPAAPDGPLVLRNPQRRSWAYLRCERFISRPGHADQLHLDLWQDGQNLALDAGTYLYNAEPPWDNRLAQAAVHNTLTVNGQDQMRRAGRFLYLEWAQAEVVQAGAQRVTARHNGYRRLGVSHERTLESQARGWQVIDRLLPLNEGAPPSAVFDLRLHWLLPDWPYQLDDSSAGEVCALRLQAPHGVLRLAVQAAAAPGLSASFLLARAGERLAGSGEPARIDGWVSPSYAQKNPALSLAVCLRSSLPLALITHWILAE